jgi:predicted DNA binding CopG/RHH family protein
MRDTFELDEEEQQIENEIDEYVPADEETEGTVRRIAQESRKRKNVNIRISERDLSQIRERASREGVPYQTLIASVLHKYVTDQLYDEREIRKTLGLMESSHAE